jgi:hypothetical protein
VVRSETLEAPAAVRSSTPRGRETQKTPRGGAHDAQTRGADAPSHALMSGLQEADARRAASRLRSVSSGAAAAIHRARGGPALERLSCSQLARHTRSRWPGRREQQPVQQRGADEAVCGRPATPGLRTSARMQLSSVGRSRGYVGRGVTTEIRRALACCRSTSGNVNGPVGGTSWSARVSGRSWPARRVPKAREDPYPVRALFMVSGFARLSLPVGASTSTRSVASFSSRRKCRHRHWR